MTIINTLPYTIANGQAVDATPVMADLNQIVSNVNANAVASASLAAFGGAGLVGYSQGASGSVLRTQAEKNQESVSVLDFGADPTGVADSTAAIQAAVASLGDKGGNIDIRGCRLLVDSGNIDIPACVTLIGDFSDWNGAQAIDNGAVLDYRNTVTSVIILNPLYTINLSASSSIKNVQIVRKGLTFTTSAAASFSGTAVSAISSTSNYGNDIYGASIENAQILGFTRAVDADYSSRMFIDKLSFDCTNGIRIQNSGDITRIQNVHGWPYVTNQAGVTNAQNFRSGEGIFLANMNDAPILSAVSIINYQTCFDLNTNVSVASLVNCTADGTNQTGTVGFNIGPQNGCSLVNCLAYSQLIGFSINDTSNSPLEFVGCRYENAGTASQIGFNITQGNVHINGGQINNAGAIGASIGANAVVRFNGTQFAGNTSNHILATSTSATVLGADTCVFDNAQYTGGWDAPQISTYTSGTLPIPINGDVFEISAPSTVGSIYNIIGTSGISQRKITLLFTNASPPTVVSSSFTTGAYAIHLSGNTNFTPTQGASLSLVFSQTAQMWLEIGRSA